MCVTMCDKMFLRGIPTLKNIVVHFVINIGERVNHVCSV